MRSTRHIFAVTAALTLSVTAALSGCGGGKDAQAVAFPDSLVDGEVIVKVNGDDITARDLRVFTLVYQPNVSDSLTNRLFNLEILNGFIDRTLLWQEAMAGGISVTDSTHQWFVNRFTEAFGGAERVESELGRFGITRPEFEQVIKRDLIVRRFIEANIASGVNITDADARAYYDANPERFARGETVRARHIIARAQPGDSDEVRAEKRAKIDGLLARARAGEDFETLARENSEGPSAPDGGDLGFFGRDEMVEPFARAAFAMKPGEISDVVETQFGFHVIQLVERREPETVSFDQVRGQLLEGMFDQALSNVLENHLNRTRSVAIIEPNFDIGGLTQRESTTFTR